VTGSPADSSNPRRSCPLYPSSEDPTTWVESVARVLLEHRGQRVHIEEHLGGDPWVVHDAVELLREFGWVVKGKRGVTGYTLIGWKRPQRWVRAERVLWQHLGAILADIIGAKT
jgi:hypothetical protein